MISYNYTNKPTFKNTSINFIPYERFNQIYLLSLKLPSWEIIGLNLLGQTITEQEYSFVIEKTRKGATSTNKKLC